MDAPPAISSIVATNAGSSIGLGTGDKVAITFDQNTNKPAITAATIGFKFKLNNGHSWGTNLADGDIEWNADGNILTITFSSVINSTIAVEDTITLDVAANLTDSGGTTPASTATGAITGSFGRILEIGGSGGIYDLTVIGLNAAIADAHDGDTIKFTDSGTTALAANININKSITLDLNGKTINFTGTSNQVNISASVTIKGPGTITTSRFISVSSGSMLTVQGDAVIEGTGLWQLLVNSGTVSMTGGTLKQTGTGYIFLNSAAGVATFNNATIEGQPSDGALIWNADSSTLTLNNCTTRNIYSGTGSWATNGSIILMTHTCTVTLNGGTVTGPTASTAPAITAASTTTLTNNGATITNGFVRKLGDLTVSVSSGTDKVTLAPQTTETGVTYYYKTTAADDTAGKPASDGSAAFNSADWTAFSAATDITTTGTATVYVQVVKVGVSEQKIYGWGQGSATPTASPPPSGGVYIPPALVTEIPNGGSTTGANLNQLVTGGKTLTVSDDNGAQLVFEPDALKSIASQTSGTIKVEMKDVSPAHQENLPGKMVFSLTVSSGSSTVTNFGGAVTVTLPYELKEGENGDEVTVWHLASDGTTTEIPCTYDPVTGLATFRVTHFSLYVVGTEQWVNPFIDISENDWFYDAVRFIAARKITTGTGGGRFSPEVRLTRGEFIVMMMRAYEIAPDENPTANFSDAGNTYYSGYLASAKRLGITAGVGNNMYAPGTEITRQEMFTLLFNALRVIGRLPEGESGKTLADFADAGQIDAWAVDAVICLVETGIVGGSNGALAPKGTTTRAEMAQVLYHLIGK
jgi:hypothetical protein